MDLQKLSNRPSDIRRFLDELQAKRPARNYERRPNPLVPGMEDLVDQVIYDSFSVAANTAFPKTVLFQTPIGSSGKTIAQTYLTQSGLLQNPQRLIVNAFGIWIANNTTPTDVINIQQNVSVTFTVGKKPMLEGPVLLYPAGRGMLVNAVANVGTVPTGSAPVFSSSNGLTDPRAMFSLAHPIVIEAGESFSVTLNPETAFSTQATTTNPAGVGTTIYAFLDGYLYRGVQ